MNSIDPNAILSNLLNSPSTGNILEKNNSLDAGQTSQKNPNEFEKLLAKISQPPDSQAGNGSFLSVSNHILAGGAINTRSVSHDNPPNQYEMSANNKPLPATSADNNLSGINASVQAMQRPNNFAENTCETAPILSDNLHSKPTGQKNLGNNSPTDVFLSSAAKSNSRSNSSLLSSVSLATKPVSLSPYSLQDLSIQTTNGHSLPSSFVASNSSASSIAANGFTLPSDAFVGMPPQDQRISLTVLDQQNHLAPPGRLSPSHFLENSSISRDTLSNSNHVLPTSAAKTPSTPTNLEWNSAVLANDTPLMAAGSGFSVSPSTSRSSSAPALLQSYDFDPLNDLYAAQGSEVHNSTNLPRLSSGSSQQTPVSPPLGQDVSLNGSLSNKSSQIAGENFNNFSISNLGQLISGPAAGTAAKSIAESPDIANPEAIFLNLTKPNVSNSNENVGTLVVGEQIDRPNDSETVSRLGSGSLQNKASGSGFPSTLKAVHENAETQVNLSDILFGQALQPETNLQNSEIQPSVSTFDADDVTGKSSSISRHFVAPNPPVAPGAQTAANLPQAKTLKSLNSTLNGAFVLPTPVSDTDENVPNGSIPLSNSRPISMIAETRNDIFDASTASLYNPAGQSSSVANGSILQNVNRNSLGDTQVFENNPTPASTLAPSPETRLSGVENDSSPFEGANTFALDSISTGFATDALKPRGIPASPSFSLQNQRSDIKSTPVGIGPVRRSPRHEAIETGSVPTNETFSPHDSKAKNFKGLVLESPQSGTLPQSASDPEEPLNINNLNGQNRAVFSPDAKKDLSVEIEHATDIATPKSVSVVQSSLGGLASEFSPVSQIAAFVAKQTAYTASQVSFSSSNAVQPAGAILSSGVKTLSLALEPQDLGGVTIKLRLSSDGLAMVVQADKPGTAQLIEKDKDKLMKGLQESGYSVETLSVKAADTLSNNPQQSLSIEPSKLGDVSNQQDNQSTSLGLQQDNSNANNGTGQKDRNPHTNFAQNESSFSDAPASLRVGDIYI